MTPNGFYGGLRRHCLCLYILAVDTVALRTALDSSGVALAILFLAVALLTVAPPCCLCWPNDHVQVVFPVGAVVATTFRLALAAGAKALTVILAALAFAAIAVGSDCLGLDFLRF